jgi:hypothetical protein
MPSSRSVAQHVLMGSTITIVVAGLTFALLSGARDRPSATRPTTIPAPTDVTLPPPRADVVPTVTVTVTVTLSQGPNGTATLTQTKTQIVTVTGPPGTRTVTRTVTSTAPPPPPDYDFDLPVGDESTGTSYVDPDLYRALAGGDCAAAQARIPLGGTGNWSLALPEPRYLMLYQAAIDLCAGNRDRARRLVDRVERDRAAYPDGWRGLGWHGMALLEWHTCEVYRAVVSALERRDRDSVTCARSANGPPAWPAGNADPRAGV